jgi:hypothetical protein
MPTIQLRVLNIVELPPIFACRRNQILGEDFDGTNQIKTDWDVRSLCWTWWRSGREPPFLETGMFLDDGLVAGSWEMFMRIWMTKRVESSVLPSMKLWSTKNGVDFRLTCK